MIFFDVVHAEALNMIKTEEDKLFLIAQRGREEDEELWDL